MLRNILNCHITDGFTNFLKQSKYFMKVTLNCYFNFIFGNELHFPLASILESFEWPASLSVRLLLI